MQGQIKLYKKLLIIIIPVIVLILFFEVRARGLENGFTLKKKVIENKISDINILILGSSHGYFSINPDILNHNSVNLAYYSQDLYYDNLLFEKYKNNLKNLKCIIVSVSYFSLWYDLNEAHEKWRKYFYKEYFNLPARSSYSLSDYTDIKTYSFAFLYRIENTLLGMINPKMFSFGTKMNSLGWNTDTTGNVLDSTEATILRGKERVEFTNTLVIRKNFESNISILGNFAKYLKENNIKLVFVTTPVSFAYAKYIDKNIYIEFTEKAGSFADGKDVFYLNYFYDKRFCMTDYYDYDHLKGSGANLFSRILKDTLENLKITDKQ
ncbi:MAG: hypothetical protein HY959_09255 [Ignavibacteriae bacterium]|nr:hypothetical protein [Ignavibacteriota bacterium]